MVSDYLIFNLKFYEVIEVRIFVAALHKALQDFFSRSLAFPWCCRIKEVCCVWKPGQPCILCTSVPPLKKESSRPGKDSKRVTRRIKELPYEQLQHKQWLSGLHLFSPEEVTQGDRVEVCKIELHREREWGAAAHCFFCSNSNFRWEGQTKQKVVAVGHKI